MSLQLIPAIDLLDGSCVRLLQRLESKLVAAGHVMSHRDQAVYQVRATPPAIPAGDLKILDCLVLIACAQLSPSRDVMLNV